MSKITVEKIKCPVCLKELSFNMYNSINVSLDFELKDKLLEGSLNTLECSCGQSLYITHTILYHKMGLFGSTMLQYTDMDVNEARKQHESVIKFMCNSFPDDAFGNRMKCVFEENGRGSNNIFEVFNDWGEFLQRVSEIG